MSPPAALPVYEVKAQLFRVLGHPVRVRILELLRDGGMSVGALQAELGAGGASHHLAELRGVGLVVAERRGTRVVYRVGSSRVGDILDAGRMIVAERLAGQQRLLEEIDRA